MRNIKLDFSLVEIKISLIWKFSKLKKPKTSPQNIYLVATESEFPFWFFSSLATWENLISFLNQTFGLGYVWGTKFLSLSCIYQGWCSQLWATSKTSYDHKITHFTLWQPNTSNFLVSFKTCTLLINSLSWPKTLCYVIRFWTQHRSIY